MPWSSAQRHDRSIFNPKFYCLILRDDDRGDFDRRFWQSQSVADRFAAAWDMVVEAELFRGNYAVESRLQRSVQTIRRRTRLEVQDPDHPDR
jgi:hypothetical protein